MAEFVLKDTPRSRICGGHNKQGGWKNPQDEISGGRNKRGVEVWPNRATTNKSTKNPDKYHSKQIILGIMPHITYSSFG